MAGHSDFLRELHRLHLRVHSFRGDAEQGPQRSKKYKSRVEQHEKALQTAHDEIKHLKVKIHEKEISVKDNDAKIAKHQTQMNSASSKKEYDALRTEIDNERQAKRVLEDEILDIMGLVEEKQKGIAAFEKAVQQAKAEQKTVESEIAGKHTDLAADIKRAEEELKAHEANLPPDLRAQYERLARSMGADCLAVIEGRSCTGCNMEITSQNYNDVRAGKLLVCKSCGRLLYMPE
jgi:predicted  nucleic acid-binding Zn-ribbon protein